MSKSSRNFRWRYRRAKAGSPSRESGKNGVGYVYVVRVSDGVYKIGKTTNINERLNELAASNISLQAVLAIRVYNRHSCEKKLHKHFGSKKVHREIFRLDLDDIDYARNFLNSHSPSPH